MTCQTVFHPPAAYLQMIALCMYGKIETDDDHRALQQDLYNARNVGKKMVDDIQCRQMQSSTNITQASK